MISLWLKGIIFILAIGVINSRVLISHTHFQEIYQAMNKQRLPTSVIPRSYYLKLRPHINEASFDGSVTIHFKCHEPTDTIVLHAHEDLNISNVQLRTEYEDLAISNISRNGTNDTMTIKLESSLENNVKYKLHIEFAGNMSDNDLQINTYMPRRGKLVGFVRGSYVDETLTKRWFALLNTSPENARRVFPCFDEPSFKATFRLSVARTNDMSTMSVMPLESSEVAEEEGWMWDNFPPTPPLSTFSFNVFISDFKKSQLFTIYNENRNFSINFYHRRNAFMNGQENNTKLLSQQIQYIEENLSADYPLSKLDIVGLPNLYYGFKGSAFGLITSEEFMLYNTYSPVFEDIADQWLCHMVTPNWWTDFNVTHLLTSYVTTTSYQKMNIRRNDFVGSTDTLYDMYSNNISTGTSQLPAYMEPYNTQRGEWFLKMLKFTLSEKTLTAALQKFISNNLYSTYTEDELWSAISKEAWGDGTLDESVSVQQLAKSWLGNDGFPVLTVTRDYDNNAASLEQHRFKKVPYNNLSESESSQLWDIPIAYVTLENLNEYSKTPVSWMMGKELTIENLPDPNSFIIMNPNDEGMFLVNYGTQDWGLLSEALRDSKREIPKELRRKLIQDAMILTSGNELKLTTALNMTLFLVNETDYSVWIPFLNRLPTIEEICRFTPVEDKLHAYLRYLIMPHVKSMGPPDYSINDNDKITFWYRSQNILERVGYQPHINETIAQINRTMPTYSFTDHDTQLILFCPECLKTNPRNWSCIENLQRPMMSMHHRYYLETGLPKCPGYDAMVGRILNGTIDDETIFSSYEWYSYLQLVTGCKKAHNMTITFFMENFDELRHRYFHVKDLWTALLQSILNKLMTEDGLHKLEEFYNENKERFGYSQVTMEDSIKTLKKEIEMRDGNLQDLDNWFDEILPQLTQTNAQ